MTVFDSCSSDLCAICSLNICFGRQGFFSHLADLGPCEICFHVLDVSIYVSLEPALCFFPLYVVQCAYLFKATPKQLVSGQDSCERRD